MLSYVMGAVVSLFCLGLGIFVIKKARGLGESIFQFSGEAFNLNFWIWAYRVVGISAFGMMVYILYLMLFP